MLHSGGHATSQQTHFGQYLLYKIMVGIRQQNQRSKRAAGSSVTDRAMS